MLRRLGLVALVLVLVAAVGVAALISKTDRGYFAPLFSADGDTIYAVVRDVGATVVGLGYEGFTPPASVRVWRDRLTLISIRSSDGRVTELDRLPPSPLEGEHITAYHGAIYGTAHVHLRWQDPTHLEYQAAVTRHDTPLSRTFVVRRVWDTATRRSTTDGWREAWDSGGGDEPQQLSGDREVIAIPGSESLPCAIAVLRGNEPAAQPFVETRGCRSRYPSGYERERLQNVIRRPDIERAERIRITYADLVARNRAAGLPEGEAMLRAGKEMERLGYYPKSASIVARPVECASQSPLFHISDMEFKVGLFPDIEKAIASPGTEIDKSIGTYITHRDYDTSRRLNEFLADERDATFYVERGGQCWKLTIDRP
jgi:hypothetical protein